MSIKNFLILLGVLVLAGVVLAACGGAVPIATEPPAIATESPAVATALPAATELPGPAAAMPEGHTGVQLGNLCRMSSRRRRRHIRPPMINCIRMA